MNDKRNDPALEKLLASLSEAGGLDELDDATIAELSDRLKTVRSQRRRPSAPRLPARALALDALDVLTVPSTPRMIASVVEARTGNAFDARALTTARRDDRESWKRETNAGKPPAPTLSPALHPELIEPVRALVTNSAWDLS